MVRLRVLEYDDDEDDEVADALRWHGLLERKGSRHPRAFSCPYYISEDARNGLWNVGASRRAPWRLLSNDDRQFTECSYALTIISDPHFRHSLTIVTERYASRWCFSGPTRRRPEAAGDRTCRSTDAPWKCQNKNTKEFDYLTTDLYAIYIEWFESMFCAIMWMMWIKLKERWRKIASVQTTTR